MKIIYDHLALGVNRFGGVQRYFVEIMKRMSSSSYKLSIILSINQYLIDSNIYFWGRRLSKYLNFKGRGSFMNCINKTNSILQFISGNYDIYHQTHYNNFGYKYVPKNKKIVTTIHDLNFWAIPQFYNSDYTNYLPIKEMIEKSDKIITVSHNTKNDLLKFFNVEESKVEVIYHGINKTRIQNLSSERVIEYPFLLFVGSRYKFKNFTNFVKSFKLVKENYPELKIICTGIPFSEEEKEFLNELNIVDSTYQFAADESMMARLYRDAEMFVYPSFYEGFGMPILEAMVYECPVVLSNASCFPEIAGDAGLYFDPHNIDDISDKILMLLGDLNYRNKIIENGNKRITLFSWDKCAKEHFQLYQSLLKHDNE